MVTEDDCGGLLRSAWYVLPYFDICVKYERGRQGVPAEIFCRDDAWSVRCVRFLRLAERSCEGLVRLSLAGEKGGGRMPRQPSNRKYLFDFNIL